MRLIATLGLIALTTACTGPRSDGPVPQAPVVDNPVPTGTDNTCGGRRYGSLVGKNAEVLETVLIMGPIQVIRPGMVTAQDYNPERINFRIGASGLIEGITCG
ncbi:hypothetical protein EU805_00390 [Salipiger sp. IMCC34102]|uniref:I78 family peptidase inhibitor n=1 Tax=Salipiger sp. IMCC34102 TaxID=2510647 RepID=UPI00101BBD56|nr:I78 family peptidase inhibitor [Salipiger sp. IMCC34102]RYH03865.1 hypothetical protein EU805_00390 [Salipiger sp. IMCC34102]